jgi:hypothetical protein
MSAEMLPSSSSLYVLVRPLLLAELTGPWQYNGNDLNKAVEEYYTYPNKYDQVQIQRG